MGYKYEEWGKCMVHIKVTNTTFSYVLVLSPCIMKEYTMYNSLNMCNYLFV